MQENSAQVIFKPVTKRGIVCVLVFLITVLVEYGTFLVRTVHYNVKVVYELGLCGRRTIYKKQKFCTRIVYLLCNV